MVTMYEAASAMAAALALMYPEAAQQKAVARTLAWVETSCAADGLPDHLTRLVTSRVLHEMALGTFPLLLLKENRS